MDRMTREQRDMVEKVLETCALDEAQRAVALAALEILACHVPFHPHTATRGVAAAAGRQDEGFRVKMREDIHAVVLEREPDMRSPYGLYGSPPMWSLLDSPVDGRTLAIRPTTVQERRGHTFQEISGICWGWHRDGAWAKYEQHHSASYEHFIERVLLPQLAAGAELRSATQPEETLPTP